MQISHLFRSVWESSDFQHHELGDFIKIFISPLKVANRNKKRKRKQTNMRVGHSEAKFYVEGLRFAPMSGPLEYVGEWSYYTTLRQEVFRQRNFVADFIRLKLTFITKKTKNSLFELPFGGLRGNVRTLSTARSEARGRLRIRHN